ncbi:DUF2510 domain-containing protein [Georgenia alba]|uniref:DUF2510 domain-containing protein n=1 Tax=Georgenia alba TaxID=2233858 RepID=A0ABW2Q4Z3_9MICO
MTNPDAGWYPDHHDRTLLRWWDGNGWTAHTQPTPPAPGSRREAAAPPAPPAPPAPAGAPAPAQAAPPAPAAAQAPAAVAQASSGEGPPLYTAPEVVVVQQDRVVGVDPEAGRYLLYDPAGTYLGMFKEPRTTGQNVFSFVNPLETWRTRHFELTDAAGRVILHAAHPQGVTTPLKPSFEVRWGNGAPVGTVEKENASVIATPTLRFVFTAGGHRVGHFENVAGDHRSMTFACWDGAGNQVADFVKQTSVTEQMATLFTGGDTYVLRRPRPIPEPLGSLVLLSACLIDTAYFDAHPGQAIRLRW